MRKFGRKCIFAIGLSLAVASPQVLAAQSCRALVLVKNDLWFAQQNGNLTTQLTNDGAHKLAVALAPGGNVIAYSGKNSPADVTLIDPSGRLLADINLNARDLITGLTWTSPSLLEARQHVSPTSNQSYFVHVPLPSGPAEVLSAKGAGGRCALSPNGRDVACSQGDAINLNGRDIYSLASAFSSGTIVQKVNASVGTRVVTTTTPAFQIDVQSIQNNTVALKVTTPDGQWQQAYLGRGHILQMNYPDNTVDGTPTLYGIGAEIVRNNNGVATLTVVSSNRGAPSFEAGPVWDPSGKRIAFIEASGASQRWLVMINRETGGSNGHQEGLDAKALLPIAGPVTSIALTLETHVVVTGRDAVFAQDIPAAGKVPSNAPYTITPGLPEQLSVMIGGNPTPTPVKGWACQ